MTMADEEQMILAAAAVPAAPQANEAAGRTDNGAAGRPPHLPPPPPQITSHRSILRRGSSGDYQDGVHVGTAGAGTDAAAEPRREHRLSWVDDMKGIAIMSESFRNIPEVRQRALRERRQGSARRRRSSDGSDSNERHSSHSSEGGGNHTLGNGGSKVGSSSKQQRRRSSFLGGASLGGESRGNTADTGGRRFSVGSGGSGGRKGDWKFDDKKTRAVFCLRVVTIITLIAAAAATATLTFVCKFL